ncbi:alpha/beta hydrolase [bacterium]|nr:alpha/beta hydrolase [bacterium]
MNVDLSYPDFQLVPAKVESPFFVIALHGRGDTFFGMRRVKHKLKLEEINYLFLNAPDPWVTETGFKGRSWYEHPPSHEKGLDRSLNLLHTMIQELKSQNIDQIYLTGFSQGSVLALEYVMRYPSEIKGFFGMSGTIFREKTLFDFKRSSNNETQVFLTHGSADELLDCSKFESLVPKLEKQFLSFAHEIWGKKHLMDEHDMRLMKAHINKVFSLIE